MPLLWRLFHLPASTACDEFLWAKNLDAGIVSLAGGFIEGCCRWLELWLLTGLTLEVILL
jgi:hypothetical protein